MSEKQGMEIIIVSGMSGSGKNSVNNVIEDFGYFCIDNLPAELITELLNVYAENPDKSKKISLTLDIRDEKNIGRIVDVIGNLKSNSSLTCRVIFLDASDDVIISRYKETRRIHPLSAFQNLPISEALVLERKLLANIFELADYKIDTTYLSAVQTRDHIQGLLLNENGKKKYLAINVMSFGFKNGSVPEADLVFDVRCFPNPFYIKELKEHTGLEAPVREYVMSFQQTIIFLEKLYDMIDFLLPNYVSERKRSLTVAIGCTGGKHRSVTIAEALATHLRENGENVVVIHRDINNGKY